MLFKSLPLVALLASVASAAYYPPFLTPTAGETVVTGPDGSFTISWNQTLPEGTTDAATTGTLRMGWLLDDEGHTYYEGGAFYNASAGCLTQYVSQVDLFSGSGSFDTQLITPGGGSTIQIIGWEEATSVHTDAFTTDATNNSGFC
ncbi:hypothetical protein MNV49_003652 [Pseudohyphozyma bogoriensis]|nr:hypothetical protein MNV49_003652 [Pseudohyphozyma bogoriensis]